jgi:hypothetical protein
MIAGGDWVTPHLDGLRYFKRPPLGYWVNASALLLLGQNNFAVRFPSAMAVGLSAVLICYLVGAACWYLKRDDVYVIGPFSELTCGLQYRPVAGRLLNTECAKRLIEGNRANALLIVREDKIDHFRKSLPRPFFEEDSGPGGYVLWWY